MNQKTLIILAAAVSLLSSAPELHAQSTRGSEAQARQISGLKSMLESYKDYMDTRLGSIDEKLYAIDRCAEQSMMLAPMHEDADPDGCLDVTGSNDIDSRPKSLFTSYTLPVDPNQPSGSQMSWPDAIKCIAYDYYAPWATEMVYYYTMYQDDRVGYFAHQTHDRVAISINFLTNGEYKSHWINSSCDGKSMQEIINEGNAIYIRQAIGEGTALQDFSLGQVSPGDEGEGDRSSLFR